MLIYYYQFYHNICTKPPRAKHTNANAHANANAEMIKCTILSFPKHTNFKETRRQTRKHSVSVSVYYVAVRTIVLSRHGSNLARPVIIHDIIHGLIYVPSTPYCGFFGGLAGWKLRLRPLRFFYVQHKVSQISDLRGSLSPTIVCTAPGSPRRSPIHLWTGRDVA